MSEHTLYTTNEEVGGDSNPYFIHSDRADCLENMKELPYVQWLKAGN